MVIMNEDLNQRNKVIADIKYRWNISDSGLGRMFKLTRERISQILEEQSVDKRLDTNQEKDKIKQKVGK